MAEAAPLNVPGATLRQERLAAALLDPNIKSKTEAMLRAGYAKSTALTQQGRSSVSVGTQAVVERHIAKRRDKARGLDAIIEKTIERPELVDNLDPIDKLAVGMKALQLRADLGVEPERGDADRWKEKHRRIAKRYLRFALWVLRPQHVVLSPATSEHTGE